MLIAAVQIVASYSNNKDSVIHRLYNKLIVSFTISVVVHYRVCVYLD